uniref:DUF2004 domain-containing protein n=1 Tax=Roseihalotalea indica TaxID=2867963 RepID=A0AA49GKW5_9BACT|nr:DUF2004 domain-containing protein [Tunicatimonas sp. TK19036]
MTIKYFEEVDTNKLEDYYSKQLDIDSASIKVDLNFESPTINLDQVEKLNSCLVRLPEIIKKSWQWILNDYRTGEDVSEYISFHLDDFFEDNPEELLKGTDSSLDNKDRFLQTLKVNRIGIYPEAPENYLIIDWMTDPELSNYILVVNCNEGFELEYITVES